MKFNIEKYNLKREKKEKQTMSYKIIYILEVKDGWEIYRQVLVDR